MRCKGMQEDSRLDATEVGSDQICQLVHERAKREAASVGRKGVTSTSEWRSDAPTQLKLYR